MSDEIRVDEVLEEVPGTLVTEEAVEEAAAEADQAVAEEVAEKVSVPVELHTTVFATTEVVDLSLISLGKWRHHKNLLQQV